jgi:hypothetical protein
LRSRKYDLCEETDAEYAGIATRVSLVVLAPRIAILTLG